MSAEDIFIEDVEQSDLKPGMEGQLVHSYQSMRSFPGSNRIEMRTIAFNNPSFGARTEVQIPSMDIIPHEMFIEFNLGAEGTVANALWQPTPTWVSGGGVDLNFKLRAVYNASEAELLLCPQFDEEPKKWLAQQNSYAFNAAADSADVAQRLYLKLGPLAEQVLSKIGPLSSYASNDWSVAIDLKAENLCMAGSNATPDAALSGMRLIILGSKAPPGEVQLARQALEQNGIMWNFLRSTHQRVTLTDNAAASTSYIQSYSDIVGAVSKIRLLIRNKALLDATTNVVASKNNISYQSYAGPNDLISVGKNSFPQEVYGQQMPQAFVRNFAALNSNPLASRYLSSASTVATVDNGVFDISFGESESDMKFGTSTGSYPVKNDLQIGLTIATDTVQDNYLDTIVYTHVRGVITSGYVNVNLSA